MCVCEEIVTCVFWILKSTEALLAASSLGMLSSMAVKKKVKMTLLHNLKHMKEMWTTAELTF